MDPIWGLVVLVVCPLLQFPVMVYLSRRVETDEDLPPWGHSTAPFDPEHSRQPESRPAVAKSRRTHVSTVVCPRCDVENDPGFTYCRDCAGRL